MENENRTVVEETTQQSEVTAFESAKPKKNKKKLIFIILAIVVVATAAITGYFIADEENTLTNQKKQIINSIKTDDSENFNSYVKYLNNNTYASDNRKAKEFLGLGKTALEESKYSYALTLFENSINSSEKHKQEIFDILYKNALSSEDKDRFYAHAKLIIDLGGTLDESVSAKSKEHLLASIATGKYSDYSDNLNQYTSLGYAADDEVNDKIYSVANECFNSKEYSEAVKWFELYKGEKDISETYKEAVYEHIIYILFSGTINAYSENFKNEREEALHYLTKEEMKNYKQSEGIRLYCRIMNASSGLQSGKNKHSDEDKYIKSKLLFPNSYKFLEKTITSDYYIKKGNKDDTCIIGYDCIVAYSAMNKYGYTVSDTEVLHLTTDVDLDGSDYILALKIFNNISSENMEKYARTGEFTNNQTAL